MNNIMNRKITKKKHGINLKNNDLLKKGNSKRGHMSHRTKSKQVGGQSILELIKYITYYFTEMKKFDNFVYRFNRSKELVKKEYESFKPDAYRY